MNCIGRLISILYRKGASYMNHALGAFDVSVAEIPFLTALFKKDGVTQEQLSSYLQIDKAATTRAIQSLVHKGFITTRRSSEDRRCNHVFLTERGKHSEQFLLPILAGWSELLAEGMDEEERDRVYASLEVMVANVERQEETRHG